MTLRNAFENLATESSINNVKSSIDQTNALLTILEEESDKASASLENIEQVLEEINSSEKVVITAPMGIDSPGMENEINSIPVTLANEQVFDASFVVTWPAGASVVGKNICHPSGTIFDCRRYRSILIQFTSTLTANTAVYFEGSNDGINWNPEQFAYVATALPFNNLTVSPGTVSVKANIAYNFLRARINSGPLVGGSLVVATRLGIQPHVPIVMHGNTAYIAGGSLATAGTGIQAIGGNISPGAAPNAFPIQDSGVDSSGLIRRLLTDSLGNQTTVGQTYGPNYNTSPVNALLSKNQAEESSITELLQLILCELQFLTSIMKDQCGVTEENPFLNNQS